MGSYLALSRGGEFLGELVFIIVIAYVTYYIVNRAWAMKKRT